MHSAQARAGHITYTLQTWQCLSFHLTIKAGTHERSSALIELAFSPGEEGEEDGSNEPTLST